MTSLCMHVVHAESEPVKYEFSGIQNFNFQNHFFSISGFSRYQDLGYQDSRYPDPGYRGSHEFGSRIFRFSTSKTTIVAENIFLYKLHCSGCTRDTYKAVPTPKTRDLIKIQTFWICITISLYLYDEIGDSTLQW